ncbi:putative transcription factor C2H2 family [Helianthus annuus]|nr:putative transcription factor C2H2 family [Helianthus annuus]
MTIQRLPNSPLVRIIYLFIKLKTNMMNLDPTQPARMSSGVDSPPATPDDDSVYFNSEFILFIGLFVILCFLFCLIALNACTWLTPNRTTIHDHFSLPAAKLLRTIPKVTYSAAHNSSDCAICLSEFVVGDEIRVLPRCHHCFHAVCIDRWIGSHFTCPSCRQLLLKTTRETAQS